MPTRMLQPDIEMLPDGDPSGMTVAVLERPFAFRLERARIPVPEEDEILVRIKYVGICGSDLEAYRGTRSPEFIRTPSRLGHEVAGVVHAVGRSVTGVKEGDKVCLRYIWGAFAQYICCKPFNVKVVPSDFPLLETSLIEIMPSVLHAAELGRIDPSKSVLIMGQGVSGLILTQTVKLFSPGNLAVTDLFDTKLALAKKYGATYAYKMPTPHYPTMPILGKDFPSGFDVVIPCLLEGDGVVDAIECTAQNGRIVLYGCIGVCSKPVDFFKAHRKRLEILTTEPKRDIDMRRFFDEGLRLVVEGLINTRELVTHVMPLTQIQKAFELRDRHREDVIHVVIDCEK